jgi:hypothetical protein
MRSARGTVRACRPVHARSRDRTAGHACAGAGRGAPRDARSVSRRRPPRSPRRRRRAIRAGVEDQRTRPRGRARRSTTSWMDRRARRYRARSARGHRVPRTREVGHASVARRGRHDDEGDDQPHHHPHHVRRLRARSLAAAPGPLNPAGWPLLVGVLRRLADGSRRCADSRLPNGTARRVHARCPEARV